jgi:hypothetical protein
MRQRQQRTNYLRQKLQPGATPFTSPLFWVADSISGTQLFVRLMTGGAPLTINGVPQVQCLRTSEIAQTFTLIDPSPDPSYALAEMGFSSGLQPGDVFQLIQPARQVQTSLGAVMAAALVPFPFIGLADVSVLLSAVGTAGPVLNLTASTAFGPLFMNPSFVCYNQTTGETGSAVLTGGLNCEVSFPISGLNPGDVVNVNSNGAGLINAVGGTANQFAYTVP